MLNRLWPLLLSTIGAGALAFVLPQVPAVATGFAIIWALAWRRQASAVTAIEERDGARFYVERTSPLQPIRLVRTPGFRSNLFELNGASRPPPGAPAGRRAGADRVAGIDVLVVSRRQHDRVAGRGERADRRRSAAPARRARARRAPGRSRAVRTFMLTDLVQARAARRAAARAIASAPTRARSSTARSPPRCCGRARARSGSTRSRPRTARAATGLAAAGRAPPPGEAPLVLA